MVACFTSFERVACSEGDRFWEETTKFLAPIKQTKPKSHLVTGKKRCLSLSRSPYKVWHKREHLYQSFGNWQKMACYLVLKRPSKVLKPKPAGPSFVALWKLFCVHSRHSCWGVQLVGDLWFAGGSNHKISITPNAFICSCWLCWACLESTSYLLQTFAFHI